MLNPIDLVNEMLAALGPTDTHATRLPLGGRGEVVMLEAETARTSDSARTVHRVGFDLFLDRQTE
jgi:hypothetical protein